MSKNNKISLIAISCILGISGGTITFAAKPISSALFRSAKPPTLKMSPNPYLGVGYSNWAQGPSQNSCLSTPLNTVWTGTDSQQLDLSLASNYDEVKKSLGIQFGSTVPIDIFNISPDLNFVYSIDDTSLSETLVYKANYTFKGPTIAAPPTLSPEIQKLIKNNKFNKFRQQCGETYISELNMGASLYIFVQLHFNSTSDKTDFNLGVDAKTILKDLNVLKAKLSSSEFNKYVTGGINIFAVQKGGDPSQLSMIVKNASSCSAADFTNCATAIDNVLNYISTVLPNQFPMDSEFHHQNAAIVSYKTADYGYDFGDEGATENSVKSTMPQNSTYINNQRKRLAEQLTVAQQNLNRVTYLQSRPMTYPWLYEKFINQLRLDASKLKNNIAVLQQTGIACFNENKPCNAEDTISQLTPIPEADLALRDTYTVTETGKNNQQTEYLFVFDHDDLNTGGAIFRGQQTKPTDQSGKHYTVVITREQNIIHMVRSDFNPNYDSTQLKAGRDGGIVYTGTYQASPGGDYNKTVYAGQVTQNGNTTPFAAYFIKGEAPQPIGGTKFGAAKFGAAK